MRRPAGGGHRAVVCQGDYVATVNVISPRYISGYLAFVVSVDTQLLEHEAFLLMEGCFHLDTASLCGIIVITSFWTCIHA